MTTIKGYHEIHDIFNKIDDQMVLHISDIAEMTGMTKETVRSWCRSGKLPSYAFGKKYIVMGQDFKSFMRQSRVKPAWLQRIESDEKVMRG